MASLAPGAQDENLVVHRGKVGDGLKPDLSKSIKTAKKPLGKAGEGPKSARKPLGDLSNIRKPRPSNRGAKDLFTEPKAQGNVGNSKRSYNLTKEEIKQCEEWAKEGVERMHYTGNDIQQHERDLMDKRVKDEVDMVMSSMHEWGKDIFDIVCSVKDGFEDSEFKLEFEPEILPSVSDKRRFNKEKLDMLLELPEPSFEDFELKFDFKIKDFPDTD